VVGVADLECGRCGGVAWWIWWKAVPVVGLRKETHTTPIVVDIIAINAISISSKSISPLSMSTAPNL
jgi:hypothetical protein